MALRDVGVRAIVDGAGNYTRDMDRLRKADADVEKGQQQIARTAKVAGVALTAFAAGAGIIGFKLVKAASDVEELDSKFRVVFGDLADQAEEWATRTAAATNRSRYELQGFLASLQDTFVPMGFARDRAFELSSQLTALAVDVASFNNANDADVLRDFQSALVGNTETVRKYGIVITESRLQQELLNSGVVDNIRDITEQQKIQGRLNLIMQGTTDAQGDAIRTADSFANRLKGLEAAGRDLQVQLGQELLPAAAKLVDLITRLISGFNGLSPELRRTIVVGGAIAAAFAAIAGPGLILVGFLPNLIAGITALRAAMSLLAVGPSAPLILLAAGLATIAAIAIPKLIGKNKEATESTNKFADAARAAGDSFDGLSIEQLDIRLEAVRQRMTDLQAQAEGSVKVWKTVDGVFQEVTVSAEEYRKTLSFADQQSLDFQTSTGNLEAELAALHEEERRILETGKNLAQVTKLDADANRDLFKTTKEVIESYRELQQQRNSDAIQEIIDAVDRSQESFARLDREMDPLNQRFSDLDVNSDVLLDKLAELSGVTRDQLIYNFNVAGTTLQDLLGDFSQFAGPAAEAVITFFETETDQADAANEALEKHETLVQRNADAVERARQSWGEFTRVQNPLQRKLIDLNVTTEELIGAVSEITGQRVPDLIQAWTSVGISTDILADQFATLVGPEIGAKVLEFLDNLRDKQNQAAEAARQLAAAQAATSGAAAGEFGAGGAGRVPPDVDFVAGAFEGLINDITGGGRPVPDWLDINFFLDSVLSFFKSGQSRGEALLSALEKFRKSGVVPRQFGGPGGLHGLAVVGEGGPEIMSVPQGGIVQNVNRSNTFNVTAQYTSPQEPQGIAQDLQAVVAAAGI